MNKNIALATIALLLLSGAVFAEQWNTGRPTPHPKYASSWAVYATAPGVCNLGIIVKTSQGKEVCVRHRGGFRPVDISGDISADVPVEPPVEVPPVNETE